MARSTITPEERVRLGREAARLAQRALDARGGLPLSRRYGTPAGLAQARRIARGEPVDAARTRAFLARFRPAYQLAMRSKRRSPRTSKVVGAYMLWGGEPAYRYLAKRV